MARARNIKPGFFKNYELADLGPMCQVLFAGLWCLADKEGRLEDKPRLIKAEVFPYYDCDTNGELTKLERCGFVRRYRARGVAVIEILNFKRHQSPHHTERASELPGYDERESVSDCSETEMDIHREVTVNSQSMDGENPPDCLIPDCLIPDSPNPDSLIPDTLGTPLSGKPDDDAEQILAHLNAKANRDYRPVQSNLKLIRARLKEGATPAEMRAVIDLKVAQWARDPKMAQYLRPDTLFNATKFAQYVGQLKAGVPVGERSVEGFLATFGEDDGMTIDMEASHA
ncbi:conserved phage C-terminal domain-containing protein [Cupriavidus taiwanensis]|uniref:conserved phage C-terminal domain-containing protein n=1 Tax=Cupriavidus taiwanensis TaxID=164546 RepID=UPI000E10BF67|nr:conserved phage C-terminal domain-containing protein [Cupriavidus taiwanensis]SOY56834.1 hypothetical protein CBM2592_A90129 [Cupriavidus taiwanensis]SOY90751.1 hypothetical protein CBM2591_A90127 [Cupriavidus taiwanensis]SOZ63541.1 hypothetical protein CBM2617_A70105 [Cupriavidus taiwanensis]SOZ82570.1 hypothetical protein CBM2618_A80106 [Cupriavidus taiwanensis]SOZ84426.1 hypothetical protein CBM2622_A80105 [Cupriavidus taiwanensis]